MRGVLLWRSMDASADDEIKIVQSLQHKDVTIFGSPFLRLDWIPAEGDDVEMYRLRWNGAALELIEPGTTGHGSGLILREASLNESNFASGLSTCH